MSHSTCDGHPIYVYTCIRIKYIACIEVRVAAGRAVATWKPRTSHAMRPFRHARRPRHSRPRTAQPIRMRSATFTYKSRRIGSARPFFPIRELRGETKNKKKYRSRGRQGCADIDTRKGRARANLNTLLERTPLKNKKEQNARAHMFARSGHPMCRCSATHRESRAPTDLRFLPVFIQCALLGFCVLPQIRQSARHRKQLAGFLKAQFNFSSDQRSQTLPFLSSEVRKVPCL